MGKEKGNDKRDTSQIIQDLETRAIGIIRVDDKEYFKFITGFDVIQPVAKLFGKLYVLVRF